MNQSAQRPFDPSDNSPSSNNPIHADQPYLEQSNADHETDPGRPLFDEYEDSVFLKGTDGKLTFANRSFIQAFAGGGNPLGKRGDEFLPKDMRLLSRVTDHQVLQNGRALSFSYRVTDPASGKPRMYYTFKQPLFRNGKVAAILGITRKTPFSRRPGTKHPRVSNDMIHRAAEWDILDELAKFSTLTPREQQTVQLISHGVLNKQVAQQCEVSLRTVEDWRQRAMKKLDVTSLAQLIRMVVRLEDSGALPAIDTTTSE